MERLGVVAKQQTSSADRDFTESGRDVVDMLVNDIKDGVTNNREGKDGATQCKGKDELDDRMMCLQMCVCAGDGGDILGDVKAEVCSFCDTNMNNMI